MTYFQDFKKEIVGKTLTKIEIEDSESTLLIHTTDGIYMFTAEGDCCSQSWIEHFSSPEIPCIITDVKEIEMSNSSHSYDIKPTVHKHHTEYYMKYYFYEIITDKGSYLIEMRNSSNGYYGGWLEYIGVK